MAAKEFIVAIELGSSKMTGIAGQKNLDDRYRGAEESRRQHQRTGCCQGRLFVVYPQGSGLQHRQDRSMPHQYR